MFKHIVLDKPMPIHKLARTMSTELLEPCYIMTHDKRSTVVVTEENLSRYMRIGYKVECCYYEGKRYKNAYWNKDWYRWDLIPFRR